MKSDYRLENISWFEVLMPILQKIVDHISTMDNLPSESQVSHYEELISSVAKHRMSIWMVDSCYFRQEIVDKLYLFLFEIRDLSSKFLDNNKDMRN